MTFSIPSDIDNFATEKYIFASVKDKNGNDLNHLTQIEKTEGFWVPSELAALVGASVDYYSTFDTTQRVIVSGEQFTVKIKPGWKVRFLNLPKGTTYSIKEINIPEGYEFVKAEVNGTQWIANMENGVDNGSAVEMTGLPLDNSNNGITGTITEANARYSTTYTNKAPTHHVNIQKTSQDGITPLSGAVFSLYTKHGYEADPKQASNTGLISNTDGKIDLGKLAYGTYYLVETSAPTGYILLAEPVVITVDASGVTYTQSGNNLSQSGGGISHDKATDPYTLTVTNNAGYELPSTGGPGTWLFTILGSILILGAGVLLCRRRRLI